MMASHLLRNNSGTLRDTVGRLSSSLILLMNFLMKPIERADMDTVLFFQKGKFFGMLKSLNI